METIKAMVWRITHYNEENGYGVLKLKTGRQKDLIRAVGYVHEVHTGAYITAKGEWILDKDYGRQFRISESDETIPADVIGIEKYLGSGIVKGLGVKQAKKIVSYYGEETLNIIDSEPEKLRVIPGIGEKLVREIKSSWQRQKELKEIIDFLKGLNINTIYFSAIYKQYGKETIKILSENLYRLIDDIKGIGFETVDSAALSMGVDKESYIRCRAGVLYALNKLSDDGNCYATLEQITETGSILLDIEADKLAITVGHMYHTKELIVEGNYSAIYLPALYHSEIGTAKIIKKIAETSAIKNIENYEIKSDLDYDKYQIKSIKCAAKSKILIITGGPGTGKTTILAGIINIFKNNGLKVLLAAPTGRAAKRMSEATKTEAKTIHRLLEYQPSGNYQRNENNQLICDAVIIDESSMIDIVLMYNLLKAIPTSARIVMIGDVDQLPSVGAGNVLRDLIESGVLPVIRLQKVYRQAEASDIIKNAHLINKGILPEFKNKKAEDFFYVNKNESDIVQTIKELVEKRLPQYYNVNPLESIYVLTPVINGNAGVEKLNQELQAVLNKNSVFVDFMGKKYKVGDKVMQIQNNYDKDVYNGDIGNISYINFKDRTVNVIFDERKIIYKFGELTELELAYAMTIHKSQGSEFPIVVLPMIKSYGRMLQRNLLYTAVTRAKKGLVIVGDLEAFEKAVRNDNARRRNTKLMDCLIALF